MATQLSTLISQELNIPVNQVAGTVNLLDDGATIPFISRYRKEATGDLDELSIQSIDQRLRYYRELEKRRATILKTIEAQDKLTPELADRINNCWDATTLEDIYLPYKPKRKTRVEAARQLVERYAVQVDPAIHAEVLTRYERLNLAPYKGFINPVLLPVYDKNSEITDVNVYYGESYAHQMLRYSQSYATLI